MATIARQLEAAYPQTNKGVDVAVVPLRERYVGDLRLAFARPVSRPEEVCAELIAMLKEARARLG